MLYLQTAAMGFAVLEGKESHAELLARQDSEIRLLELMRRCVVSKIKHDREYANALVSVATQGQKLDKSAEEGGSVLRAWKVTMEELEILGKLFKSNADSVEKDVLDKLNGMCGEKRKMKKQYQDEYNRLCQQFSNLTEEVSRKRNDYCKHLEMYKLMRSRFEEHYVKCGKGGRKLEEVRDKYQRSCRRLHLVHNEYVLLIAEAQECQKDFNNVLLPCLMSQQLTVFQDFLNTWKELLKKLVESWDVPIRKFAECCRNAENFVNNIQPAADYGFLTNKQNGGNSTVESDFIFDGSLVEDTTGRLQADRLAVDNLTVDWVRNKMADLEVALKECQIVISAEGAAGKDEVNLTLLELRSKERRLMRQIDFIKKALQDIGCEELPNGCDITTIENGIDNNISQGEALNRVSPKRSSLSALANASPSIKEPTSPTSPSSIVDMLWKPFRRKSAPNSPTMDGRTNNNNAAGDWCTDISVTDVSSGLGSSSKSLVGEEWFHGVLPREEVVRLLTKEGDFLVRETTRNDENQTVLSVCWGGHKHFIVQTTTEGEFRFEGAAFPTVPELINYQYQSGLPVTSRSGAILRQAILRERWELNNDDVYLIQKIGRGNFGDVYKAKLKSTNQEVAVKTCRVTVPDEHKKKFLQEGRILKQYDHPNIVKLIGICVQKQPIMIVMELVPGGSLLMFLRSNASILSREQLLLMCRDAAAGMRYLEGKNCIHRDLAARNCLVGKENVVKISDFGMSREEEEYIVSDGMKQIPIKWTAPEALNFGKYTCLCDVWSYGILCWEIFSRGGTPYPGLSNSKAREKIDAGYRMPSPEGAPEEMYRLMLACWEYQPENRPHFDQIHNIVETLAQNYS